MHIVPNWARDADTAHGTRRLQPSGNVHSIAVEVGAVGDCVAHVDTDAEANTTTILLIAIIHRHLLLHLDSAAHSTVDAVERDQKRVSAGLHDPAAMFVDRRVD